MDWKNEWKKLAVIVAVFAGCFYLPIGFGRFNNAVMESLHLVKWYAREHVLLCLVPAFFIAGAISVFVSQASVMILHHGGLADENRNRTGNKKGRHQTQQHMFLRGFAVVCWYLQNGGRIGACNCVSVFRPRYQCPGNNPDRPGAWP